MKKLLFSRESACIQPLRELVEIQKHRTLAMWAVDCAGPVLAIFEERYSHDKRPHDALVAAKAWMQGDIKMPAAKKAIHAAHNAASEVEDDPAASAAARATGHAAATVHVETHALGLVFYGLTAVVYSAGSDNTEDLVLKECRRYYDRLLYWEANIDNAGLKWAPFLLRGEIPNKERLLRLKNERKDESPSHPR